MVSAVVAVTGADTPARLARAVHRLAGTLAGVLIAAALLAPHLPALAVIAVLQGATELAVGRHYAIAVMLLTPLALAMGTLAQPVSIMTLLHDRTIETILGVAIGVIISLAAHKRQPRSSREVGGLQVAVRPGRDGVDDVGLQREPCEHPGYLRRVRRDGVARVRADVDGAAP